MKMIRIFVPDNSEDGFWAIHFDNKLQNEFDNFFDCMNDTEWLHDFFEKNKTDLKGGYFGSITIGEAVLKTLEEIEAMENVLFDYTEQGFAGSGNNLQYLF